MIIDDYQWSLINSQFVVCPIGRPFCQLENSILASHLEWGFFGHDPVFEPAGQSTDGKSHRSFAPIPSWLYRSGPFAANCAPLLGWTRMAQLRKAIAFTTCEEEKLIYIHFYWLISNYNSLLFQYCEHVAFGHFELGYNEFLLLTKYNFQSLRTI